MRNVAQGCDVMPQVTDDLNCEAVMFWVNGYLRDGPLENLWGGRGIFEPQEFFFVIKFLV